jgi:hypothetical protein
MCKEERKANLFLLGAAKCGSTTLSYYLNQHPDILLAKPKEPLFFEAEYDKGNQFYQEKYFSNYNGETVLVDARHRNLYLPFVAKRIKEYVSPDAKFIVIVREPIARAYSHWWHNYSWGDEKRSFADSINANLKRLRTGPHFWVEQEAGTYRESLNFSTGYSSYVSYIDTGFYAEQIKRYICEFGASRVKVLFLDDLNRSPKETIQNIFSFIGVDYPSSGIDYEVQNKANSIAGKNILRFIKVIPGRKCVPQRVRMFIYKFIRTKFIKRKQSQGVNPQMQALLKEIYEPHIAELESLTGRNLNIWRNG